MKKANSRARAYLLGGDLGPIEPGPPMGWPEFTLTLRFYVTSDDEAEIRRERQRVFEKDWRVGADD